jgi:hypothetical protein
MFLLKNINKFIDSLLIFFNKNIFSGSSGNPRQELNEDEEKIIRIISKILQNR